MGPETLFKLVRPLCSTLFGAEEQVLGFKVEILGLTVRVNAK